MKKKMPRHDEQFDAMMQVIYLMDAAYAIYRATYDEDPVTPEEVSIALGWHPGFGALIFGSITACDKENKGTNTDTKDTTTDNPVVEKTLTGITVNTDSVKKAYTYGEALDLTGLVVTASYSDSTTAAVTSYTTDPANGTALNNHGDVNVTVTYEGKNGSFKVTVSKAVTSISFDTARVKKSYEQGDALDLTGLTVTANYSDGTSGVVTDYTTNPANGTILNEVDNFPVTLDYQGQHATLFAVTVNKKLAGISLNTDAVKKEYAYGEPLDLTGLVVTANYTDNTSGEAPGYTTNPADRTVLNTLGENEITVSYNGKTASFKVVVNKVLTGIDADVESVKKAFKYGETLDLTGLVVTAFYNDNSSEVVTDYTVSPANGSVLDTVGNILVNITYGGQYTNYMISVAKEFTTIDINTDNVKKEYKQGETLDLTGLVVTAHYNDGTTEDVTDYTTNPLNGATLDTVGTKTIAVTFGDKTKTFDVTVSALLESITLNTANVKKDYTYNTKLNLNGLKIIGHYSDGTTAEYTDGYTSDPANGTLLTKIYSNTVTISFGGKTASFDIWVSNTYLSLTVDTTNVKKTYQYGEALDLTGIVAIGHYGNGDTKDHTAAASYEPANGTILNEIGSKTIKVSYAGHSTTFNVDVRPNEETGTKVTVDLNRQLNFGSMTASNKAIFTAYGTPGTLYQTTMYATKTSTKEDAMANVNGKTRFYKGDYIENTSAISGITKITVHGGNGYFNLAVGYSRDSIHSFLISQSNGGDRIYENIPHANYFILKGTQDDFPADIESIEIEYTRNENHETVMGTPKAIDDVNVGNGTYQKGSKTIVVNGDVAMVDGDEYTFVGIEYMFENKDYVLYKNHFDKGLLMHFEGLLSINAIDTRDRFSDFSGTYSKNIPATCISMYVDNELVSENTPDTRKQIRAGEDFSFEAHSDGYPIEEPSIRTVNETEIVPEYFAGRYDVDDIETYNNANGDTINIQVKALRVNKVGDAYKVEYSHTSDGGDGVISGTFDATVSGDTLTFSDGNYLTITLDVSNNTMEMYYDNPYGSLSYEVYATFGHTSINLPISYYSDGMIYTGNVGDFYVEVTTSNNLVARYYFHCYSYTRAVVELSKTSHTIDVGGTYQIPATVNEDATNKTLTYTSNNPTVASVSESGVVTGLKAGTAKITVTTADNSSKTITITVNDPSILTGKYDFADDYSVTHTIEFTTTGADIEGYIFVYDNGRYVYEDDETAYFVVEDDNGTLKIHYYDDNASFVGNAFYTENLEGTYEITPW